MAKRSITQRVIAAWRRIYRHAWALRFRRLLSWQPLTSRGFLALFLAGGALYFLALPHKDLVAAMLGGGILAVLGLVLATSVIVRWRLASRLQIEARFDHTDAKSRRDLPAGLLFKGSSLPPYFTLAAHRSFARPGVRSRVHLLKGKHPEGGVRHVIDTLYIPHRGL
ncbi:MAG: hypothetical protein KDD69_15430, partial [Bdellovibrionales bacterium]|nr:hypothetical protein [Bdellovibrionales bacterium]